MKVHLIVMIRNYIYLSSSRGKWVEGLYSLLLSNNNTNILPRECFLDVLLGIYHVNIMSHGFYCAIVYYIYVHSCCKYVFNMLRSLSSGIREELGNQSQSIPMICKGRRCIQWRKENILRMRSYLQFIPSMCLILVDKTNKSHSD